MIVQTVINELPLTTQTLAATVCKTMTGNFDVPVRYRVECMYPNINFSYLDACDADPDPQAGLWI